MKKLATHNGSFHADEVFATAILKKIYPESTVTRTRDEEILNQMDIVYDVGGGKYDHHTNEKEYRKEVPYAAFGLIWRDYGIQYLELFNLESTVAKQVHQMVDEQFIQGIDAVDNGVRLQKSPQLTDVAEMISVFNPVWVKEQEEDRAFEQALKVSEAIFEQIVYEKIAVCKSESVIKEAYENREIPEVLVLNQNCNWMQQVQRLDKKKEILFIIYPDRYNGFRIQVIPTRIGSFEARKDLPQSWGGKTKEELNQIIGIEDSIFCHPGRFIAGTESFESCWKMAMLALK